MASCSPLCLAPPTNFSLASPSESCFKFSYTARSRIIRFLFFLSLSLSLSLLLYVVWRCNNSLSLPPPHTQHSFKCHIIAVHVINKCNACQILVLLLFSCVSFGGFYNGYVYGEVRAYLSSGVVISGKNVLRLLETLSFVMCSCE